MLTNSPLRRSLLRMAFASIALVMFQNATAAENYPTKPIRVIVPFPAGAGTDTIARTLTQHIGDTNRDWKFVIENRAGAGGNIGVDAAAKAQKDGYTLVLGQTSNLAVNPSLYQNLPYDPIKDLTPIALVTSSPIVIAVPVDSRFNTLADLEKEARERPGMVTIGFPGNGTVSHLTGELIQKTMGVEMQNIPYKGAGQAMVDLVGGRIDIYLGSVSSLVSHVRTGVVKTLGITSLDRSSQLPDTPTLAESGYPGFDASTWFGFLAPAGTPESVVYQLNAEFNKALQHPEVASKLKMEGGNVLGGTPEEFAALLKEELPRWAEVVKASGAKID